MGNGTGSVIEMTIERGRLEGKCFVFEEKGGGSFPTTSHLLVGKNATVS